jgi:predicted acylesterase/phospholipase RssA
LAGVWGKLTKEWLHELVPDTTTAQDVKNLYISATPVPNLLKGPLLLSDFQSKSQVIEACMASVHIPLFMDGKLSAKYKDQYYIDGSFWSFVNKKAFKEPLPASLVSLVGTRNAELIQKSAGPSEAPPTNHMPPLNLDSSKTLILPDEVFVLDWHRDLKFREVVSGSIVSLISPEGLYEMMDFGYKFMKQQYELGSVPDTFK